MLKLSQEVVESKSLAVCCLCSNELLSLTTSLWLSLAENAHLEAVSHSMECIKRDDSPNAGKQPTRGAQSFLGSGKHTLGLILAKRLIYF